MGGRTGWARRRARWGIGVALALVGAAIAGSDGTAHSGGGRSGRGRCEVSCKGFWATDRAGDAVLRLDEGFAERARLAVASPVRVVAAGELAWVASATEGHALGAHRVSLLGVDGATRASFEALAVVDLDASATTAVWVEWFPPGSSRTGLVTWADAAGARRRLQVGGRPVAAACDAERVLVARDDGVVELWRASHPPRRVATRAVGTNLGDVERGRDGRWFALDVATRRLHALGADLTERWSVDVGLNALSLAPDLDRSRVWIVDTTRPVVRRFGPEGALELHVGDLPLGGFDRAAPTRFGGLVLAAPGALLELDAGGALLQSQGGYRFLTDVCTPRAKDG